VSGNFFNVSLNVSTVSEGVQNITILANDTAGNLNNSIRIGFTVDRTPPNSTLIGIANDSNQSSATVQFNASVTSTLAAVHTVRFNISNGSAPVVRTASNVGGNFYNVSLSMASLTEGDHNFTIIFNDTAGNQNVSPLFEFQVDRTAPVVLTTGNPANNSNVTGVVQFNFTVTDAGMAVHSVRFNFSNGTNSFVRTASLANASSNLYNVSLNTASLAEAVQNVTVLANDTLNNLNGSVRLDFTVDRTAPKVLTTGVPVNNSYLTSGSQQFNFTVTDVTGSPQVVRLNFSNGTGASFFRTASLANSSSSLYNVSLALTSFVQGGQNVTVWANDTHGNLNSSIMLNFTVDTVTPGVSFNNPVAGAFKRATFSINVTVNGTPSSVEYRIVNGSNSTRNVVVIYNSNMTNVGGNYWNDTFVITSLADGNYTLFVNASDVAGNINISNITFAVDDTAPSISSLSCSDVTVGVAQSCTCSATDGSTSFGGSVTTSAPDAGTSTVGTKTVTCNATDSAGNSVTTSTTYAVSAVASSSTGGGGGGSGAAGGLTVGQAGQYEKKIWVNIDAGETATVKVRNGAIGLTEVSFNVGKYAAGPSIKVTKVDSLPSSVKSFSNKVYKNIQITHTGLEGKLTGVQQIKLKVEKKWLVDNKLGNSDVALFRFADDKWNQLKTTFDKEDDTYAYFTSETPGFSYFVIGEKSDKTAVVDAVPEVVDAGEEVAEPVAEPTEEPAAEPDVMEKVPAVSKKSSAVWLWVVVLLLLVGIGWFWFSRGKTTKTKPLRKR